VAVAWFSSWAEVEVSVPGGLDHGRLPWLKLTPDDVVLGAPLSVRLW